MGRLVRFMLTVAVGALGACDATAPWTAAPGGGVLRDVTLSPALLTFNAEIGTDQWFGDVSKSVAVRGLGPDVFLSADGPPASFVESISGKGETVTVRVKWANVLGTGTYQETVKFRACWSERPQTCWSLGEEAPRLTILYVVSPPSTTVSPPAVEFERLAGGPLPPPQVIRIDGPAGDGPWTLSSDLYTYWLSVAPASGTTTPADVTVWVTDAPTSPMTRWGGLQLSRGSHGVYVPVEVTTRVPITSVASDPLAFTVRARDAFVSDPPKVTLTTEQDAAVVFFVSATYDGAAVPAWLAFPSQVNGPGTFSVGLATTALPVGRHTATLRVRDQWGGSDVQLPVVVDVSPSLLSFSPAAFSFVVGPATTPAEVTASLMLSATGSPVAWTASADVAWLAVAPSSGTTGPGATTLLDVSVVPTALAALPRGVQSGSVQVVSTDGQGESVIRVPVSLDLQLPLVSGVGPGTDVEGTGHDVAVMGEGLDPALGLLFGGVPAASVGVRPHLGVVATPPPLAAGIYRVTVPTAMGVSLGDAMYRVVPRCDAAPAAVDAPGLKARIWFDDATCALWSANVGTGALERRRASAGWAGDSLVLDGLLDAAPTPDGRILTWSVAGTRLVDAASLSYSASQPTDDAGQYMQGPGSRIVMWGDGWAMLFSTYDLGDEYPCLVFDPDRLRVTWQGSTHAVWAAASPRVGVNLVTLASSVATNAARDLNLYDFRSLYPWGGWRLPFFAGALALDRMGTNVLALQEGTSNSGDSRLFRNTFEGGSQPGKLPAAIAAAALTQDGTRAIAFDGVARTVRTFDLSVPPDGATGLFVEVGTGIVPAGDPGAGVVLALSADDRILFLSGDARTAVVPLP